MATPLTPIECSAQPLSISFHPARDIVAAGLADGTVEIHDVIVNKGDGVSSSAGAKAKSSKADDDGMESDDEADDTILCSIQVAKEGPSTGSTQMLARTDAPTPSGHGRGATQGPSCRSVLFSRSPHEVKPDYANSNGNSNNALRSGGEALFTACNGGSMRCLDTERACSLADFDNPDAPSSTLWSIENAHGVGINRIYQLPHYSPCGPALVSGDDVGAVRLWDTRICGAGGSGLGNDGGRGGNGGNPFDNLMKPPAGCVQHWKVNHDYVTDFTVNDDGTTLFASSADGTLSVFDVRFPNRKGTPRSVTLPGIDLRNPESTQQSNSKKDAKSTWETSGYSQSDNQEDELLSLCLLHKSTKLLCGTQQGVLSIFSYGHWGDISDRFPGHPQSIDALLKIDERTVLTGSSDGVVRAVQLLPNALLGVMGGHDGFPVEALGWSAGRKVVGSVSHDEYIRLWDGSFLNDDGDDDEMDDDEGEEDGKMQSVGAPTSKLGSAKAGDDSEDDWEDMDEDEDKSDSDDDDDDSDSDDSNGGGGGGKPKKREKIFKTENEAFFSDL